MPSIDEAHRELDELVRARPGVQGTGRREIGSAPLLLVYVSSREVAQRIPRDVAGFRVETVVTGPMRRRRGSGTTVR